MKKIITIMAIGLSIIAIVGCGKTTEEDIMEPIYREPDQIEVEVPEMEEETYTEPEYSRNSLIIMVEEGTTREQVIEMCEANEMSITYEYDSMNGYALSINDALSDAEFENLMDVIRSYDFILSVEKDYIMQLDEE